MRTGRGVKDRRVGPSVDMLGTWSEGWRVYRRLLSYAFVHWPILVIAAVAMVVMALTEAGFAALMKPLLDDAFASDSMIPAYAIPLALLALFALRGVAEFVSQFSMKFVGRHVVKAMRADLFARLVDLPLQTLERGMSGQWVARVTYNAEQVATAATDGFATLVRDVVTIVVLVAWMLVLSPLLTVTVLAILPAVAVLATVVTRHFRRNAHRLQFNMGDVTHVTQEVLDNHRVVRLHGAEEFERERFEHTNERNRRIHLRIDRVAAAYIPTVQFFVAAALAVVIWIATSGVFGSPVTAGTFVSFLTAMLLLLTPIRRLTTLNAKLQRGIAAGQSIFEVIDAPGEPPSGLRRLDRARGEIVLEDVWFRYPAARAAGDAAIVEAPISLDPGVGQSRRLKSEGHDSEQSRVKLSVDPATLGVLPQRHGVAAVSTGGLSGGDCAASAQDTAASETCDSESHDCADDAAASAWVLRGVALHIAAGERVALVGPSGSGKTTLMQLLPGFYRPTRGRILLDGEAADEFDLVDRRRQFAWVGQNVTLFSGSVLENIAYGDREPDRKRAEQVARDAEAWSFIEGLPQGLDTPIGEDGSRLSGGQRQRLAIARALYRDAPILLLDEPTSALDPESEGRIQAAIERAMRGRTTVVIAHRLHTVRDADRIVVLEDGCVVEQGRHAELVAQGGRYVELLAAGAWRTDESSGEWQATTIEVAGDA